MKVLKIERDPPHTYLEAENRLSIYHITYKLKGNKHHKMTVFATNEMHAFTRALSVLNKQGESK